MKELNFRLILFQKETASSGELPLNPSFLPKDFDHACNGDGPRYTRTQPRAHSIKPNLTFILSSFFIHGFANTKRKIRVDTAWVKSNQKLDM